MCSLPRYLHSSNYIVIARRTTSNYYELLELYSTFFVILSLNSFISKSLDSEMVIEEQRTRMYVSHVAFGAISATRVIVTMFLKQRAIARYS